MRDDVVSHKPPRGEARWHSASNDLLEKVLDSLLRMRSRAESPGESQQKSRQTVLDTMPSSHIQ